MFLFCTDTQIGKLFVTRLCDPEMLFEREQKLVNFSDSFLFYRKKPEILKFREHNGKVQTNILVQGHHLKKEWR